MTATYIPYKEIRFFSKLISDYVNEEEKLRPFYNNFPSLLQFKKQINEKECDFSDEKRNTLVASLKRQYAEVKTTPKVLKNRTSVKFIYWSSLFYLQDYISN